MQVEQRQVASLVPHARNARTHSAEQVAQIAASITAFGFCNPVLIDPDGGIIAGHGRVLAAQQLGLAEVPCIALGHLSDEQRRAFVIADNRLAQNAGWNDELLRLELTELQDAAFDVKLLGFSDAELQVFLRSVEPTDLPGLASGDRQPFQVMSFTLHDDQAALVQRALARAKDAGAFEGPNQNSNGNALARVCETFLAEELAGA